MFPKVKDKTLSLLLSHNLDFKAPHAPETTPAPSSPPHRPFYKNIIHTNIAHFSHSSAHYIEEEL